MPGAPTASRVAKKNRSKQENAGFRPHSWRVRGLRGPTRMCLVRIETKIDSQFFLEAK